MWGSSKEKRKIHWVNLKHICNPAECGGLGTRSVPSTNRTLLNKWLWRFGVEKITPSYIVVGLFIFETISFGILGSIGSILGR